MKKILDRIKPTPKEERELKKVFSEIKSKIKIKDTKIIMGGSTAKGTYLKNNHDIDIYVRFGEKKYAGLNISAMLKKKLKFEGLRVLHGSRDYFQFEYKGFDIEVVPLIEIKNAKDAHNITDISPLHVKWVKKHKNLTDEIRLVKAFCKSNGLYGAESYIRGFSGYSLEILTIYYGGFEKMLKEVTKWKPKVIIDIERYYPKGNVLEELNRSKKTSPLILIDPVQATRNVTAVVGMDKFLLFKDLARKYLRAKKRDRFFVKNELNLEKLKKKHKDLFVFEAVPFEGKRDVVGAKLLKCYDYLFNKLKSNEFKVINSGWDWEGENAVFWYALKEVKLTPKVKHYGPRKEHKDRLVHFKEKWGRVRYEEGVSFVMKERDFMHVEELFIAMLDDEYVGSKVVELNRV
ncbi:CCA tRNA nucleotidyltransferase [archaeon]|jgi:tRNA nucleotidyltransferase (CCA-adding enzyme)|nr:CCA tRNA nucleotidyltransferase [archaeon]MBT4397532.1 CCA tRNA nucleotidyltransferase [archaeon]MBT4440789.1 CCA tRNA nucleotidyltransferase [archaeon]